MSRQLAVAMSRFAFLQPLSPLSALSALAASFAASFKQLAWLSLAELGSARLSYGPSQLVQKAQPPNSHRLPAYPTLTVSSDRQYAALFVPLIGLSESANATHLRTPHIALAAHLWCHSLSPHCPVRSAIYCCVSAVHQSSSLTTVNSRTRQSTPGVLLSLIGWMAWNSTLSVVVSEPY